MACFDCEDCYKVVNCQTGRDDWEPLPNCVADGYIINFSVDSILVSDGTPMILIVEKENGVSVEYASDAVDIGGGSIMIRLPGSWTNEFLAGYEGFIKFSLRYGSDYDVATFGPNGDCYAISGSTPSCLIMKVVDRSSTIASENTLSWVPFA